MLRDILGNTSWYSIDVSGNDRHILLFYKKLHFCHLLPFAKVGQNSQTCGQLLFISHYFCYQQFCPSSVRRQLRARRALLLFNNVLQGTRRALSLYKVYADSVLLILNAKSLNSVNTLLVLSWWHFKIQLASALNVENLPFAWLLPCNFKCWEWSFLHLSFCYQSQTIHLVKDHLMILFFFFLLSYILQKKNENLILLYRALARMSEMGVQKYTFVVKFGVQIPFHPSAKCNKKNPQKVKISSGVSKRHPDTSMAKAP